jgi:hypothetical protein
VETSNNRHVASQAQQEHSTWGPEKSSNPDGDIGMRCLEVMVEVIAIVIEATKDK